MKMVESKFGAPVGFNYLGKFMGTMPMKDDGPRLGRDGKPMEPGIEWQWEITHDPDHDGEHVGKIVGRITSPTPTLGNACGELLSGLVGRSKQQLLNDDRDYEPNDYVGFTYQLVISAQKDKQDKTQVTACKRVPQDTGTPPAPPRAKGASPPTAAKPAPRSAPPPPAKGPPLPGPERFYFWDGTQELHLLGPEITSLCQDALAQGRNLDAEMFRVRRRQNDGWQTPAELGLESPPY